MKTLLIISVLVSLFFSAAYSQLPNEHIPMKIMNGQWNKRWQTTGFAQFSVSNNWFNQRSFAAFSAPIGVQVTRQLTKNLYAFGRLSISPAFFSFNNAFNNSVFNKTYSINSPFNNSLFNIYPRAEAGLFYINDEKTFSISGSLLIDRNSQLLYPSYGNDPRPSRIIR